MTVDGVGTVDGFEVSEIVDGLAGPTQVAASADGRLLVAQLNGGENDATGQVLLVDLFAPEQREVLFDGLDKPTGVAQVGDSLWVMQRRSLWRSVDGGPLTVVMDDLPFNGRSESTLTPTPDGGVLYATSGDQDGSGAVEGSGVLWRVGADGVSTSVARGLKNGYGHVFDRAGSLWVTEIGDGSYDGSAAPDELVAVSAGDDFGWPVCIGNGEPVVANGGSAERCASTPPSHALFAAGATPTSVAVAPWDPDTLVVTLWNEGRVVTVPREPGDQPWSGETLITGIAHPQHVLAVEDRLLVVDLDNGRILAIERR